MHFCLCSCSAYVSIDMLFFSRATEKRNWFRVFLRREKRGEIYLWLFLSDHFLLAKVNLTLGHFPHAAKLHNSAHWWPFRKPGSTPGIVEFHLSKWRGNLGWLVLNMWEMWTMWARASSQGRDMVQEWVTPVEGSSWRNLSMDDRFLSYTVGFLVSTLRRLFSQCRILS